MISYRLFVSAYNLTKPTLGTSFQAEIALKTDEVPVGCVFVHKGEIIGRGMNDTNRSLCVSTIIPHSLTHIND